MRKFLAIALFLFTLFTFLSGCIDSIDDSDNSTDSVITSNSEPTATSATTNNTDPISTDNEIPSFLSYIGMPFKDIEAKLGIGTKIDFSYEMNFVTFKFGDSDIRFIFEEDGNECHVLALQLKDIIPVDSKTRIDKSEFEQLFSVEKWDTSPNIFKNTDFYLTNVYSIYGKYFGYHYNLYPEANEENKTSVPINTYLYFTSLR